MIDTHTHIYLPDFKDDLDEIIDRCKSAGVKHLVLPNIDEDSLQQIRELHSKYPEFTSMAIGIHPTEIKNDWEQSIIKVRQELTTGEYVSVGEIGLDLYWDKTYINQQMEAFKAQLLLAEEFSLPVIIHSRDAYEETVEVIKTVKPTVPLIFHSFTGSKANVLNIRKICDPYFGINGVITYKNAHELREAVPIIGLDKIILETDSPYLTPVPFRGKRNESSYLPYIRDKISQVLSLSPENVELQTDENAKFIFRI